MSASKLNVVIAHSEPLLQLGLESVLNRCADLHVQIGRSSSFDVAVTDLDSGMALASAGRVLIVTSDDSEVAVRSTIEAGIRGYLLAQSTPDAVIHAVRRVAQGGTAIDPRVFARMVDSLNGDRLTERQIDVLRLIALGRPNKAVARQLGISLGTVKCHMKHLMAKLNARSRTEAAAIAQRRGLVPPDSQYSHGQRDEQHRNRGAMVVVE